MKILSHRPVSLALIALGLFGGPFLHAAESPKIEKPHVTASIVVDQNAIAPGATFWLGVRYQMEDKWHIYWKNPGDTGLPTEIDWRLPDGFTTGKLQWPTPQTYLMSGLMNWVYEDEVVLMTQVTAPDTLKPGDTIEIRAESSWLICKDVCIPGDASLSLTLPVAQANQSDAALAALFASTMAAWPRSLDAWQVQGEVRDDTVTLLITGNGDELAAPSDIYFFSESPAIDANKEQPVDQLDETTFRVLLTKSAYFDKPITELPGVLKSASGWIEGGSFLGLAVDPIAALDEESVLALGSGQGGAASTTTDAPVLGSSLEITVLQAFLFAFIGGIILNLMPCVFPVLGIKIMGFVQQAGEDSSELKKHGLVFALGVILSVWVLVGLLLALRAGGEALGWGFQLQEPRFVAFLIALFFLFGLNLAGVFEIGTSMVGVGSDLQSKSGLSGSFFSGVLAVAVATPCTAPFMGAAIGFALAQSIFITFATFTLLGLGLALPYIVLSFAPALIQKLPRPGAWMESFKQFMAFPLFATVIWLLWVYGLQTDMNGVTRLLAAILLMGMGAWIFGRWGAPHRKTGIKRFAYLLTAASLLSGAYIGLTASQSSDPLADSTLIADHGGGSQELGVTWETWSANKVEQLQAEGKTVYVDFTAAWCLTCQANKKVVFSSQEVRDRFNRDPNLVLMKADWTKRDPAITEALAGFGRSGVPLNVIYTPDGAPKVLPTALTPSIVLDALPL